MENEENRGLFYKKAYEDQFTRQCSHFFKALSLYIYIYHSWTLRIFLEQFGIGPRKERKKEETNKEK